MQLPATAKPPHRLSLDLGIIIFTRIANHIEDQVFIDEKPEYYSFANDTKNMTGSEIFEQFAASTEK